MNRIRKNDTVFVVSGKDKGKSGQIIELSYKKDKVKVKGIGLVTKHAKARKTGEVSSIKKMEAFIAISNVMPICSACRKPTRVGVTEQNGRNVRNCKKCHANF